MVGRRHDVSIESSALAITGALASARRTATRASPAGVWRRAVSCFRRRKVGFRSANCGSQAANHMCRRLRRSHGLVGCYYRLGLYIFWWRRGLWDLDDWLFLDDWTGSLFDDADGAFDCDLFFRKVL